MELDQLKEMWKEQPSEKMVASVEPLLGKKSNSPIAKMKRHLLIELISVVVLYGLIILYFLYAHQGRFISVSILYFIIGFTFSVYYFKKFRLLREMECMACQVKANLSKQVSILEKYVKIYLWAGTLLMPTVIIFLYWFEYAYFKDSSYHVFIHPTESVNFLYSILILIGLVAVSTILFYFLNKWYVHKLYGRHIVKLREMLAQMEDE